MIFIPFLALLAQRNLTMSSSAVFCNKFSTISIISTTKTTRTTEKYLLANSNSTRFSSIRFGVRAFTKPLVYQSRNPTEEIDGEKPRVLLNSLRVLEWNKVCDVVSSFAGTSVGREASKEQLWSLDQTYDESLRLLRETNAAVEIHKYNNVMMDFTAIDVLLVKSAIDHARRALRVDGCEAIAVAVLLQFAEALHTNIKAAIKENADLLDRFMPLAELILDWVPNKSLVRSILQVVDEDGSIKDSASPKLKQARWRVLSLESKLNQLMNTLIANEMNEIPSLEASNIDGRWCIRSGASHSTSFKGLLLSSGAGMGNIIEPVSAVPLNDELQEAKASVANAEAEVLLDITAKMKMDLDGIEKLLESIVELDVVSARARYGLSFGGTYPELLLLGDENPLLSPQGNKSFGVSYSTKKNRKLCLPKAYHPLLVHQHRCKLQEARKDVANATAELRRRKLQGENVSHQVDLQMLQEKVTQLEKAHPIPVDFVIEKNTRVLLITGPNTGGKTICLKSVGLAAIMAKAGLYVLCSEPARIPWFDFVFADIGDEQSLSQSLSTFSGHLRQITDIQVKSTSRSLVLLDEIGAGTNPLEGAALGMSILEYFAEDGAFLTIATTHHGELKMLKYSNECFENACMEFDEINLKPTYKILWGVPGRSNAINIAERLGLPKTIVNNARQLYGAASAEIDEVIFELEKFKQNVEEYVHEAQHYWMLSKDLHERLQLAQRKLDEHGSNLSYRKMQKISEFASVARSTLHKKMQEYRTSVRHSSQPTGADMSLSRANVLASSTKSGSSVEVKQSSPSITKQSSPQDSKKASLVQGTKTKIPKVGDTVHVISLGTKATVLKVEPSKEEVLVQAGNLRLKLNLYAIKT